QLQDTAQPAPAESLAEKVQAARDGSGTLPPMHVRGRLDLLHGACSSWVTEWMTVAGEARSSRRSDAGARFAWSGSHPATVLAAQVVPVVVSARRHAEHLEHEGVFQRRILERLVATAHATMAGAQFGFQQQQIVVGLARTQLGDPLRRFPVLDPAVVVTRHR